MSAAINSSNLLSEFPSASQVLAEIANGAALTEIPNHTNNRTHLTDSHCHLDFPIFDADREAVLARAQAAGVERFFVMGISAAQWPRLFALAQQYSSWRMAFGLHPYFLRDRVQNREPTFADFADDLALLPTFLEKSALAVGEIGLDAAQPLFELQVELFKKQLNIAADVNLPVILHHRKTLDKMLPMVKKAGVSSGIVHAFSGSYQQAMQWVDAGFRIGVGGVITYPRAQKTRAAIAKVPLESLVLETDSPDMPLFGQQGQRNEPADIAKIAHALLLLRE